MISDYFITKNCSSSKSNDSIGVNHFDPRSLFDHIPDVIACHSALKIIIKSDGQLRHA